MYRQMAGVTMLLLKWPAVSSHCKNGAFMYNLAGFIVIGQQTKKKPLVTKFLTGSSYSRGRRCRSNYDQFLSFGQVIPKGIHRQPDSGERRWFLKKPILDHNLVVPPVLECSPFRVFVRLVESCSRVEVSVAINKESQILVISDFRYFLYVTAYLAELSDVGRIFSAMPLLWGWGECTLKCSAYLCTG